jgi:hypothetical protein
LSRYPCTVCGEGLPTEEALMAHVEDVHLDEKTTREKPQKKQNAI